MQNMRQCSLFLKNSPVNKNYNHTSYDKHRMLGMYTNPGQDGRVFVPGLARWGSSGFTVCETITLDGACMDMGLGTFRGFCWLWVLTGFGISMAVVDLVVVKVIWIFCVLLAGGWPWIAKPDLEKERFCQQMASLSYIYKLSSRMMYVISTQVSMVTITDEFPVAVRSRCWQQEKGTVWRGASPVWWLREWVTSPGRAVWLG